MAQWVERWSHTQEISKLNPTGGNFCAAGKCSLSSGKAVGANSSNITKFV